MERWCLLTRGGGSSVGRTSDWKARPNTDTGSSPRRGKGFFVSPRVSFQCRLSYGVRTVLVCNRMHQHLCARWKSQIQSAIPLFGRTKTLHTLIGMAIAAPATAVPYPGKDSWISSKGKKVLPPYPQPLPHSPPKTTKTKTKQKQQQQNKQTQQQPKTTNKQTKQTRKF